MEINFELDDVFIRKRINKCIEESDLLRTVEEIIDLKIQAKLKSLKLEADAIIKNAFNEEETGMRHIRQFIKYETRQQFDLLNRKKEKD